MLLRCRIDGLLLPARPDQHNSALIAWDGHEPFALERIEARYYELVAATENEQLWLERNGYRLLRVAADFRPELLPLWPWLLQPTEADT